MRFTEEIDKSLYQIWAICVFSVYYEQLRLHDVQHTAKDVLVSRIKGWKQSGRPRERTFRLDVAKELFIDASEFEEGGVQNNIQRQVSWACHWAENLKKKKKNHNYILQWMYSKQSHYCRNLNNTEAKAIVWLSYLGFWYWTCCRDGNYLFSKLI